MIATCPVPSAACHVTRVRGKVAARVTGPGDTGHLILLQPLRNKIIFYEYEIVKVGARWSLIAKMLSKVAAD